MNTNLIKCNTVNYRKGYVEVIGEIHSGCINLESWNVHPECDIAGYSVGDEAVLEDAVVSNTEIELSVENAERLIQQLQSAIERVKSGNSGVHQDLACG